MRSLLTASLLVVAISCSATQNPGRDQDSGAGSANGTDGTVQNAPVLPVFALARKRRFLDRSFLGVTACDKYREIHPLGVTQAVQSLR